MGRANRDRPNQDLRQHVPCAYHILNPKTLSKFESWKEEVLIVSPNCQNSLRYATTNKLLIEDFFKEGSNPRFCPSLRHFTYNSNTVQNHIDTRTRLPSYEGFCMILKQNCRQTHTLSWYQNIWSTYPL